MRYKLTMIKTRISREVCVKEVDLPTNDIEDVKVWAKLAANPATPYTVWHLHYRTQGDDEETFTIEAEALADADFDEVEPAPIPIPAPPVEEEIAF